MEATNDTSALVPGSVWYRPDPAHTPLDTIRVLAVYDDRVWIDYDADGVRANEIVSVLALEQYAPWPETVQPPRSLYIGVYANGRWDAIRHDPTASSVDQWAAVLVMARRSGCHTVFRYSPVAETTSAIPVMRPHDSP